MTILWWANDMTKLFSALGSNKTWRVTLPLDRAWDSPCHQGIFTFPFFVLPFVLFSPCSHVCLITFLFFQLHWMRQTFNNKNQKTYDEYRQGCRWNTNTNTRKKAQNIFPWPVCRLNGFPPRCSFILRRVGQVSSFSGEGVGSQKKKLKKVIFGIALIENDASIVENAGEE